MNLNYLKGDRTLVWGEDFRNRESIQSRGGIITACTVGAKQGGSISPTGASGSVMFGGTKSVLANANKLTFVFRFQTGSTQGSNDVVLSNAPSALNDNCFSVVMGSAGGQRLYLNLATSASDVSTYSFSTGWVTSTLYHVVITYDGTAAGGVRVTMFQNAAQLTRNNNGTPPTLLRPNAQQIAALNYVGGTNAPPTDFILYSARIFSEVWNQQQITDDYLLQTYSRVYGGGF